MCTSLLVSALFGIIVFSTHLPTRRHCFDINIGEKAGLAGEDCLVSRGQDGTMSSDPLACSGKSVEVSMPNALLAIESDSFICCLTFLWLTIRERFMGPSSSRIDRVPIPIVFATRTAKLDCRTVRYSRACAKRLYCATVQVKPGTITSILRGKTITASTLPFMYFY